MVNFRVGVDIGGTFTDIVFLGNDGTVLAKKIASSPEDYSRSVLEGIQDAISGLNIPANTISEVSHGFTVATNAIIEGKGAKTALITTKGFRDILELRRNRIPRLYDLYYEKPPTLVSRELRFEVRERLNYLGEVLVPLNVEDVEQVVTKIIEKGVESVAICTLHSYANPVHERYIADVVRERAPDLVLTVSSDLLPERKEYERTSTTVINSYVRPEVERYLTHLTDGLQAMGIQVPLTVMQSNGGLATYKIAKEKPVYCIESGPAAGVVGAHHLGKRLGLGNLMTLDMGGTTAKASIIENGELLQAPEYEVGGGINVGHRLLRGAGHILKVPAIDLAEVGAGGGSIATVDNSGSLRVGPQSSGAIPGPACYGQGGQEATVTDADVMLGYLNPQHLLSGDFSIDLERGRSAVNQNVAMPLGISETDAAYGVHLLVNSNMGRALRAVSSERGRDPRRFTLFAFGGSGPVHAAGLADMLGILQIIVPPFPGVFSSFGLLFADVEHHFVRTYFKDFGNLDLDALNLILEELWESGHVQLAFEGFDENNREVFTQVDMRYEGQASELTVRMPSELVTRQGLAALAESFEQEHERTFGYRTKASYQLVNIRVIARGFSQEPRVPDQLEVPGNAGINSTSNRKAYFGPNVGWMDTPVIDRAALDASIRIGPTIVEEYDSTCIVPPGWNVSIDRWKNIVLERS